MFTDDNPITHSLAAVEWPRIQAALEERVSTSHGLARARELAMLDDVDQVSTSLRRITELRGLIEAGGPLGFGGIHPIGDVVERAEKAGRLEVQELAQVLSTQRQIVAIGRALEQAGESPLLRELAGEVHPEDELVSALARAIAPNGEINERAFPALKSLRKEIDERRQAIHRHLEGILRARSLEPVLQDKVITLRGHRYVVPVKADFKGQLPGIVHDVSASGMTLFVEPQAIVDETNALTLVERQLDIELDRILKELSGMVGFSASSLRHNIAWVGRVDVVHAQALLSRDYQGSAPDVGREQIIALKGVAHPLMLLASESVVRNTVELDVDARCLIVSGANTGGKTVLLKSIGLCALLVRAGMHIPAGAGSRMDLFTDFWADVGDRQDLRTSLSTYSAQIRFLARVLEQAGNNSLVLLDELMTGTEPIEGAALARQVLEALATRGAKTIVTTHYGELKLLADQVPGMVNGSVSFDGEKLRPTYHFSLGIPGASYALPIASRYGLPQEVVARAEASLSGHAAQLDSLLRKLHSLEADLLAKRSDLEREHRQLERRDADLAQKAARLDELERRLKRQERGAVSDDLREARQRIAEVIRDLQGANSLPIAGKVRERLAALEADLLKAPEPPVISGVAPPIDVGDAVYVASLERTGVLNEIFDDGASARVQFGQLVLEVPRGQLLPAGAAPPVTARPRRPRTQHPKTPTAAGSTASADQPDEGIPHVFQTVDNTLDLRGRSLEEATAAAEQFFDQCIVKHVNPVVVIHGHGTGRLKSGLRDIFRSSRYVERFRPGRPGEGSDGVTVVALHV